MAEFWSLVLAGAVAGGLYAIMASGLVLTYQASGIFNIGHGAVAFTTALAYFQLNQPTESGGLGLPVAVAAIIAILVIAPLLGVLLDTALFRRLADAPEAARLVGAVGVLIALPAATLWIIDAIHAYTGWLIPNAQGEAGISPPGIGPTPPLNWSLGRGIAIDSNQVAVLLVAGAAAVGLWLILQRTRLGLETRAGVDRAPLARLRGIDTDRSSRIVWALSTLLAGCAGVLIAPLFDLAPITFNMIVFTAFTAAVAAKLRSLPVTFIAGIALGVIQNVVYGYSPQFLASISGFRSSVPFILLFLLLFFVQNKNSREAGTVAEENPRPDPRSDLSPWRRRLPWVIAGTVLLGYVLFFANNYWTGIFNRGLVLGLVFLSFVVVTGIGGMVSLAQATFVTTGGFAVGWLVNHQWPTTMPIIMDNGRIHFWLALIIATGVAALVGLLVALPSLRLGGLTLALATLALAFIGDRLIFQLDAISNGSRGWSIRAPKYGPIDLANQRVLFVVLFIVVCGVVGIVGNLMNSATGRSLMALRSSAVAATTAGVDPVRTKLTLFAISAGLAGFAGGWYGLVNSPMTNLTAPAMIGLIWLAVAVTFGIRRPGGAVIAGLVYASIPVILMGIGNSWTGAPWTWIPDSARHLIANPELAALLFGLGAITLAREPDGVLAETAHALRERRAAARGNVVDNVTNTSSKQHGDIAPATPQESTRQSQLTGHLVLDSVRAGYGEIEVLHEVSLAFPKGSVTAILGPNGAGKSTLCGVIAGHVPLWSGSLTVNDTDISGDPDFTRARNGIVVAPESRGIFPNMSVDDNLAVRLRSEALRDAARERFPILGERRTQLAGLLSGGEQQQLSMTAVLMDPPQIFIADEPSLGLAPMATEVIFEILGELRAAGSTLILVEEQAGGALALADYVAIMSLGKVVWYGPAEQIDRDQLAALYMGQNVQ